MTHNWKGVFSKIRVASLLRQSSVWTLRLYSSSLQEAPNGKADRLEERTEIHLQRCDRLPVAILQADKADKRFLIDTAVSEEPLWFAPAFLLNFRETL